MRIDRLAATDLDAAVGLSQAAGWNQVRTDWRRLLASPDARCFAGRVDGDLVATSTAITYDEQSGWVGMVLVHPDHRRQGYGTTLTERALDHGNSAAESVGLDATDAGRPLYRDLGFVDVTDVERRAGVLTDAGDAPRVDRVGADREAIADFDAERCGVRRDSLLDGLLDEPGTTGFVVDGAQSHDGRGYAVLRPGRNHWQLGPVVADSDAALDALLTAAAAKLDGESVLVDCLREDAGELFAERGLSVYRTLTRMSYRHEEPLLCGDAVHAAAGLELG